MTVAELRPGDYVGEYDATVLTVEASTCYEGAREVTFDSPAGRVFLFFADYVHVGRPGVQGDAEAEAEQRPRRDADWEW